MTLQQDFYRQPQATGFALQGNDRVFIRKNPAPEMLGSVEVLGEVVYPGKYVLDKPEMRVSETIQKAGGLKAGAFLERAVLLGSVPINTQASSREERLPLLGRLPYSSRHPHHRATREIRDPKRKSVKTVQFVANHRRIFVSHNQRTPSTKTVQLLDK